MRTLLRSGSRSRAAGAIAVLMIAAAAASTTTGAQAATHCSRFGTTWARSYDRAAVKDQNPTRILAACCEPTKTAHVSSCFLTVGEVGVTEHGCERIDLNAAGAVVSEGKHETCP